MTYHTIEGLKDKARFMTCTISCSGTESGQQVHGVCVGVQNNRVTCLYDPSADAYLWIMNGQFMDEVIVRAFLDSGKPPVIPGVTATEALGKFDKYRVARLPALATDVQTEGREKYETLTRLNEQWLTLYTGPEGYLRINQLSVNGSRLPSQMLAQKADAAEDALFGIAEKFMAECDRLKLN